MFTPFVLLLAAGAGFRLTLSWFLRTRYNLTLTVPQLLAGAVVLFAGLPGWLQPIPIPLPVGFLLGAFLPDLVLSRRPR